MTTPNRLSVRRRAASCLSVVTLLSGGLLAGCDSDNPSSAVAGDPASAATTGDPTADPTDPPTTADPTDPPTTAAPADPPTTSATGDRLTAAEYAKDWAFKLDGVRFAAKHVHGTDYPNCKALEVTGSLTSRGCRYGVKVTFEALNGKVVFTHMILEMASEAKAKRFSNDKSLTDADFNYTRKDIVAAYDKGKWRARSAGKYVVITVCTGAKGATNQQVKDYLHYANADFTSALLWR